jgi:hypothetical protein
MSVKMEGEFENLVLGVNPLYYHLGIAQQYGVQTLAIAHFKGKLKVSVGKIYARRLASVRIAILALKSTWVLSFRG